MAAKIVVPSGVHVHWFSAASVFFDPKSGEGIALETTGSFQAVSPTLADGAYREALKVLASGGSAPEAWTVSDLTWIEWGGFKTALAHAKLMKATRAKLDAALACAAEQAWPKVSP